MQIYYNRSNSSPIDELGNWCLKGQWGGQLWKIWQGGNKATLEVGTTPASSR